MPQNRRQRSRAHAHLTPLNHVWEHQQANPNQDVKDAYNEFIECKFSRSAVQSIEKMTRGQAKNEHWFAFRKGAITGSKAHRVFSRTKTLLRDSTKNADAVLKELIGREPFHSKALEFGNKQEPIALTQYFRIRRSHHDNYSQRSTGLYVSRDNPLMGVSPDAVCYCNCCTHPQRKWLVEVKALYKYKGDYAWDAALKSKACFVKRNGRLGLDRNHQWYYQIQMQLGVVGVRRCDLVICTERDIAIVAVYFDWRFYNQLMGMLNVFAEQYLYPKLHTECRATHDTSDKVKSIRDLQQSQKRQFLRNKRG